ncbi:MULTISPECIES: hypothetical protein [unclassified Neisseria]|uniref:hypothetical protein n=1 Tax=unclassified Neisseria TaxID=2623750 RepID=UPI001072058A|nr:MULTISPECIES: hypothetical protein [unclassified Neisseria]MBF0803353.1 hypothetical protein [Neisseria sp. 19428wB4_WF04]TFU44018.1 hypothetical protein E4T99_03130 [Neisseria sp. WF04]
MKTKVTPQTLNLRLSSADAVAVAAVSGEEPRKFSGIANSGRPFGLGTWQTVIDFDGIKLKDKTAFLIDHAGSKRAGVGKLSVTSDGLYAEGTLLDNEHGRAVAEESDQGFPWEMSVYVQSARVEELSAGAKTSVNGYEVQGPMLIMRDCAIREVSFTAVGVDGNTHAVALSEDGKPRAFDYQPKQEHLSMTPEEKAEFDQLKADKAKLEQENADLKLSAHKAQIDAKLSAAGFKAGADGKFSGVGESTYKLLLFADLKDAEAVIADLKPAEAALSGAGKPPVPEALLSDAQPGNQAEPAGGVKLSVATGKSSLSGGVYV